MFTVLSSCFKNSRRRSANSREHQFLELIFRSPNSREHQFLDLIFRSPNSREHPFLDLIFRSSNSREHPFLDLIFIFFILSFICLHLIQKCRQCFLFIFLPNWFTVIWSHLQSLIQLQIGICWRPDPVWNCLITKKSLGKKITGKKSIWNATWVAHKCKLLFW